MIKISFSSRKNFLMVDISGNKMDFADVNIKLRKFLRSDRQRVEVGADVTVNPFNYEKMLETLTVVKGIGAALVSVHDERELLIQGSVESLNVFLSNVDFVSDGYHIHYEYYEGNDWISPDSLPLVITSKE